MYERIDDGANDGLVLRIRREAAWKRPKFSPKLCSVHGRVLNDEAKITNMLEGWHRRFSSIVAKHIPNIYDFLGYLRLEQSKTETVITKLLMGDGQRRTRKASQARSEIRELKTLWNNLLAENP